MPLLSDEEVKAGLDRLEGWEREGDAIRRSFQFKDFVGSIDFVNRLVGPAEEMSHHPDLEISWNTVTVSLSTHSQGGITENDLELAERIQALA